MTTDAQTLETTNTSGESGENAVLDRLSGLPSAADPEETSTPASEPVDDGLEELDWEGQSIKVPKGLKEAVLRTDDYTRKTQELAEQRRSVEHLREQFQTRQMEAAFNESIAQETQQLHVIDAYLAQVNKTNWSELPVEQILRQRIEIDGIKEQRQQLLDSINGKRTKFTTDMQARIQELRGKSRELASKSIQGFTEDTEKAMREFAKAEGLNETELDNVLLDPRSFKIIWKAMQYEKARAGAPKAQAAAERVLRPGAAGERMPAKTAEKLNFAKAMKAAGDNSAAKARVIEERLTGVFAKR